MNRAAAALTVGLKKTSNSISAITRFPVSYTHLTLPTNREV